MSYFKIPGVDEINQFPPEVRQGIADSPEVQSSARSIAQYEISQTPVGEQALRYVSLGLSADVPLVSGNNTNMIAWNVEVEDPNNMHNTTNLSRVTINLSGLYMIIFAGRMSGSPNGTRSLRLFKNNVQTLDAPFPPNGTSAISNVVSDIQRLNAGDYIEALAYSNPGGSTTTTLEARTLTGSALATTFRVARIGS